MKALIDANLSPRVVDGLRAVGIDAVHVGDLDLLTATDDEIFDRAAAGGLTVITGDSDFGTLLAYGSRRALRSSTLRRAAESAPEAQAALLVANLPRITEDLDRGAIVSLSPTDLR